MPDTYGFVSSQERFEAIYHAHAGAVRSYSYRRCDAQAADDVTSEVFVVAWRRLDEIPPDALPWLLGVARRIVANQRRGRARREALWVRLRAEYVLVPGERADQFGADDGHVLDALSRMREKDREALLLIGWEGLSPAQAACVLGLRANTFEARLSSARRRLEAALAEPSADSPPEHRAAKVEAT